MPINLDNVTNIMLGNTPVEQITDSQGNTLWTATPVVLPNYFYVEDISGNGGTLSITKNNANAPTVEVFCSEDRSNWTSMGNTDTTAITATVPANGKLFIKANTDSWALDSNRYNNIKCDRYFNVGGNVMSLLYGDNFEGQTSFPSGSSYNFTRLLYNNIHITDASNIHLPATTLAEGCYAEMFRICRSLTTIPVLPATTLAGGCYQNMFQGCSSLTTAPVLPATTLARNCYSAMFNGCTSLTTAPALPATTLANNCYNEMFKGCTSLTTAPALPATTLADNCYTAMFAGCTSLTTAPVLPVTTLATSCYSGMFYNCQSLTAAPVLPATTLTTSCYDGMFQGCSSLATAPALPAITLQQWCYRNMFQNCSNLNSVTISANNISAKDCLTNWLSGVAATGDFDNKGTATYTVDSPSGIPTGWTEYKWYSVTINTGNNGRVSVNGVIGNYNQRVRSGTVLTIEGLPDNGYLFSTWSDGNTTNPRTVTVNSNLSISSTFTAVPNYMYVEDVSGTANTLSIVKSSASAPTIEVFKSTDTVNWESMGNTDTTAITATVPANGRLYLKATATNWASSINDYTNISTTGNYNVGGNIMSLLYSDNFESGNLINGTNNYAFTGLFTTSNVVNANNLILPTGTARSCYNFMFRYCYLLETTPILPATILAQFSCRAMFYDCSRVNRVTTYANDISATDCTAGWLYNVAATGDFYNNGTATYTSGASGIPTGWTEHRPNYFYVEDISGSDNTLTIKKSISSAPTIEVFSSTDQINWTSMGSTSTTGITVTIPANGKLYLKATADAWGASTYSSNSIKCSGNYNIGGNIMSLLYGDNHQEYTSFSSKFNLCRLFYNNTNLVNAENLILPATTLTESCYYRMFYNCSALTTAPALPATTLVSNCYNNMFGDCTNLNSVTTYATDISAINCLNNWLAAVSATGDFYNLGGATYPSGVSGIPSGWTIHTSL